MVEGEGQRLVQYLIPHLAIEALDVAIPNQLARHDVVQLDPLILRPGEDGVRGEFGAFVADDQTRSASPNDESHQLAGNPVAGNRGVRDNGEALVRDIIDHIEDLESPAIGHLVKHEVELPSDTWPRLHEKRGPDANGSLTAVALAHLHPFLPIESVDAVDARGLSLPPQ